MLVDAKSVRTALLEFLAKDSYAAAFQSTARLQAREAHTVGAGGPRTPTILQEYASGLYPA